MSERIVCRRGVSIYLATAVGLALGRLALFMWINHRYLSHRVTETVSALLWLLYPEGLVIVHTPLGMMHSSELPNAVLGVLLVIGSFVLATPALLLAYICRRARGGNSSGKG